MTKAAQVIQNQFRNYCEHKRFKKCQEGNDISALINSSQSQMCSGGNLCKQNSGTVTPSSLAFYRSLSETDKRPSREGTPNSCNLK